MTTVRARLGLGVLTGLLSLVAMVRLVAGAFTGAMSQFAWVVTLVAMVPWVGYVAWRARRARLSPRAALVVLALDVVGFAVVLVLVFGPVLALAASFAAFAMLWLGDRPARSAQGTDRFVAVEELRRPEDREPEDREPEDREPEDREP